MSKIGYDCRDLPLGDRRLGHNMLKRIRVSRVVTSAEVVEYHLRNTLNQLSKYPEFSFEIVGTNVSQYRNLWPQVEFIDIEIERKIHPIKDLIALAKLTRHLWRTNPDVIHSIMPKAGLISALAGFIARTPVRVHTFTGQIWSNQHGLKRKFFILMDRLVIAMNSICFTDSSSQSEFLLEHAIGYANRPIPVLASGSLSGVDLNKFDPLKFQDEAKRMRKVYGITELDVVFVFIGRKFRDKGVFELIEAFHRLNRKRRNTYLFFVGPDDSSEFTNYFKTAPKEHVISHGHTRTPELFLASSDVLVLPSYREGFGSIVIDAAAMGLPAIATKISGLVDAVEEGVTGILVEMKDSKALEDAMDRLFCDIELRKKLGQAAKKRVQSQFSSERVAEELFDFYRVQVAKGRACLE